ncbi:MAG: hypothetical protein IKC65_04980 [Lentisphaeria bacterium]|nr:hypothetical protein [Lentisphaeria bacterium]
MKIFSTLIFSAVLLLTASANESLIFDASYDTYNLTPDKAKGSKQFADFKEHDLQLRMYAGVKSNALSLMNTERLSYSAKGNFHAPQGTIALWLQLVNYDLGNAKLQSFFAITGNMGKWPNGYHFRLLKNGKEWKDYLIAQIYFRKPGMDKAFSKQVHFKTDPKLWQKGTWHHVAVTWNKNHFFLYIDGVLHPWSDISRPRLNELGKGIPPDYPSRKFADFELPPMPDDARIRIGNIFSSANAQDQTAFDRFQIYDRPLNAQEIRNLYEEVMPPKKLKKELNMAGIPVSADPQVFARCFMLVPMSKPFISFNSFADLRRDTDNLYVRFVSDRPCGKKTLSARDGNLWVDDSFELHLKSPRGEYFQFIINGNNAVWDRKNNNVKWNASGLKSQVKHTARGWEASLVIPLRNLGPLKGKWLMDVCAMAATGRKNNYYRWSNVIFDGSFTATGEMMFLNKGVYFTPLQLGDLSHGSLDLKTKGSKVRTQVSYLPVSGLRQTFPGDATGKNWKITLPAGNQSLNIEAKWQGVTVYRCQADYYVDFPLEFSFNTKAKEKKIHLKIDFSNAGGKRLAAITSKGIKGTVFFKDSKGKIYSKGNFSARSAHTECTIPYPSGLSSGEYYLEARAENMSRTIAYRVPLQDPYRLKVGNDDTVPPPWTPVVKVNDSTFKVWNRVYTFAGNSPFPARITAGKEELLTRAPQLSLMGEAAVWQERRIKELRRDRVLFEGRGTLKGIPLAYTAELWFDGMLKIDWSLAPEKKILLDDMKITYQVPEKFAKFVFQPEHVPWKNGRAAVSLVPERSYKNNCLWLAGYEKGLFFWVKSNANWVNKPGEKPLTARQTKGAVDVSLNIITRKAALDKKAAYTMVFLATPSRPLPKDFREGNAISHGRCSEVKYEFGNTGCGMDRPRRDDASVFNGCYPRDFKEFAKHTWDGRNYKNVMYTTPGHLSDYAPDFDLWNKDDISMPGLMFHGAKLGVKQMSYLFCSNATDAPADLWSWWTDDAMKKLKNYNGLYFDLSTVRYCENPAHGCGGIDAFGQKYLSNDALGLRNFFLRCYKTVHKNGGTVIIHAHVAYTPITHFCDYFAPGENTCNICQNNFYYGYCEDISPETYQTDYNQYRSGVGYQFILQNGRAAGLAPNMKKELRLSKTDPAVAVAALTPMVVHDINTWGHYVHQATVNKRWRINREIRLAKAVFRGYWTDPGVKSGTPGIFASLYQWQGQYPYKAVIAAGNFKRTPQKARLSIDFKKLKLDEKKVQFTELWSNRKLSRKELDELTIGGASFVLIGIK